MKFIKNILIYLSILSILVTFVTYTPKVYAEVPETQKAQPHSIFNSFGWQYGLFNKAWTIADPTGIPETSKLTPQYFYTSDNVTFFAVDGYKVLSLITTGGLGLVLKPSELDALIQYFLAAIGSPTQVDGGVYDRNNNFLGYALNDISGCYYEGIEVTDDPDITIPKEHLNNMYNFYMFQTGQNKTYADYITVYPPSLDFIKRNSFQYHDKYNVSTQQEYYTNLDYFYNKNENLGMSKFLYSANSTSAYMKYAVLGNYSEPQAGGNELSAMCTELNNLHYIQRDDGNYTHWDYFCEDFNLYNGKTTLDYTELWNHAWLGADRYIGYYAYDDTTNERVSEFPYYYLYDGHQSSTNDTGVVFTLGRSGSNGGKPYVGILFGNPYTVYKDLATYNAINVTNDYQPNVFV